VINNLAIDAGIKNALTVILNAALKNIQSENAPAACGELHAFIDLVEAQRSKAISSGDADSLIAAATRIRAVIGC
jgi:hypothetical protein